VLALRGDLAVEFGVPLREGVERCLTDEDKRALDALGPDLVGRIVRGEVPHRPLRRQGSGDGGLSDRDEEEMERKVREQEAREREAGDAEWVED
jgi:hypothetical protein